MENEKQLVDAAISAREMAYTPYSHFNVGAALLTKDGKIYRGCNIENAAFTPTNCAERTAFFKAISEGEREFTAIAVVGGKAGEPISEYCPPCGVCRQVMMEFCDPESFRVILAKSPEEWQVYTLREIIPLGFSEKDLSK
jgi:cytidine deaminase